MGRAAAAAVVVMVMATAANAQERSTVGQSPPNVGQAQPSPLRAPRVFDIPPQPLATALNAFGRQAGVQVSIEASIARGVQVQGVSGTMLPEQALSVLLSGTGIQARFTSDGIVMLTRPVSGDPSGTVLLDPVQVQGQGQSRDDAARGPVQGYVATASATATKTDTPLVETPQSISVVTADQIQAQGAQRIEQALSYTPGVTVGSYGANPEQDYIFTRGFLAPFFLDGIRQARDTVTGAQMGFEPYGFERIEVLRGPSSMLYGQIPPGGMVNFVAKRPMAQFLAEAELQYGSYNRRQLAVDVGGKLDADGHILARLTALGRLADGQMNFSGDDRLFVAPALTLQPSEDTKLTLLLQYQKDTRALRPVPLPPEGTMFSNPNGTLPTGQFLGEPSFDSYFREQFVVGYEFLHRFNPSLQFRQNLKYSQVNQRERFTYVDFVYGTFPFDLRTVDRTGWDDTNNLTVFGIDNQLQAAFGTGPLEHTLLAGLDYRSGTSGWHFAASTMSPIDAFNPVYGGFVGPPTTYIEQMQRDQQLGVYLQDQIKFGRFFLTAGLRHDWTYGSTSDFILNTFTDQNDKALTGRIGLNYLFDSGVAPYVAWSTSFDPTIGVDGNGRPFKPTTGQQWEIGVKYQPPGQKIFMAASLFDIVRRNVLTRDPNPPPTNPFAQVQTGEVRVRGIELEAKATLPTGLNVAAAYTYLDSRITQSNNDDLGRPLFFTPTHQAALWADYTFQADALAGFGLGAGMRFRSSVWGLGYEIEVPSYTLFDAAFHFDFGRVSPRLDGVRFQLNARNVFDAQYISTCSYTEGCFYGDRRTVLATLRMRL